MEKEEKKVNFDLSLLTLDELVILYEQIVDFLQFLESKIIEEEKRKDQNE